MHADSYWPERLLSFLSKPKATKAPITPTAVHRNASDSLSLARSLFGLLGLRLPGFRGPSGTGWSSASVNASTIEFMRLLSWFLRSGAASARIPAVAYCQGTPLRSEIEARDAQKLEQATAAAEAVVAARFGTSAVDGRIQAHLISVAG